MSDIAEAIKQANDNAALREQALKYAIQAIRKMQYGAPGQKATLSLADAFYKFLRGDENV